MVSGHSTRVGAGHDLMKLVMRASRAGLAGTEVLAGSPGTVGGAVRMNAGGAFGQIGPLVEGVQVMAADGTLRRRSRGELVFGYRRSNIVEPFILEAELALSKASTAALSRRVREIFDYKRKSQPMADRSAGCTFRNPEGAGAGTSAGAWIDQAGLKGARIVMDTVTVTGTDYMEGMIPHHSIAILTSERAQIKDPRVRELANEIIKAQRREIKEMEWLIADIEKNGVAQTMEEASRRPVPDFSSTPE